MLNSCGRINHSGVGMAYAWEIETRFYKKEKNSNS